MIMEQSPPNGNDRYDMQGFAEAGGKTDLIGQLKGNVKVSYLPHQNIPNPHPTLVRLQRKNLHTPKLYYKSIAMATILW